MITRALTASGDWTLGNGQQNYLRAEAAIEQNIKTTVMSWIGDCYYAMNFGVDWYNLLGPNQQQNLVQAIKQAVANCYGVVSVLSINGNFTGGIRLESVTAGVATIFTPNAVVVINNTTGS